MRNKNPLIIYGEEFLNLNREEQWTAIVIDMSRHLYALYYARLPSIGLVLDDFKALFSNLEDFDQAIADDIRPMLEQCLYYTSQNFNSEHCRKVADQLLVFIVTGNLDDSRAENPSDDKENKVMDGIVALLGSRGSPMSAEDIVANLDDNPFDYMKTQRLIQKLVKNGEINKIGNARNSKYELGTVKLNPSDLSRHAVESDISGEIKDEKPLPKEQLAVLSFHPTSGKPWKVSVLNKKGKPNFSERFVEQSDAEVLFDSLG